MTWKQSKEIFGDLAKTQYFQNQCYVCHKRFGRGFAFHHLYYTPEDRKYSDFKRANDYKLYVVERIKRLPAQFLLLCRTCHRTVESGRMMKNEKWERYKKAVALSRAYCG